MSQNSLLNSIIAKLAGLDERIENIRSQMNEALKNVKETESRKQELDLEISREIDKIKHGLYDKLNKMVEDMKNHQTYQRGEALKLQQEISILKKDKLDLYQKVTDLQRKIADMEMTIGQDYDKFR